ncbi:MAG: ABC transporter ATP-binding protein [Thermoplasmata archaeon]
MAAVLPLAIERLSVNFGERAAVTDVSLAVRPGEFLALTGPNGSGKTTLLRAVLGLERPRDGTIRLFGASAGDLTIRARALQVAWVPQEGLPRDNVTLLDYVLFGRYAHLLPLDREGPADLAVARDALGQVGLLDRADAGVLELSGGERQRAVLARALAQQAPLLLLDEPTAHLDIGHQLDLLGRVRALVRDRGTTVVAALHDLNLAGRFADRIVVLSRGRCVADGTPTDVLSEDLLARVWGVEADLRRDPRTGAPYLLPHAVVPRTARPTPDLRFGPVHVVGGGGAAGPILRALVEAGYSVTTGALHLLDSDSELAESLRVPSVVEVPFAPLGEDVRSRHRVLLSQARAIVLAAFAVGPSNLANLEDTLDAVERCPTFIVVDPPIAPRDFTGGRAERIVTEMIARGARPVRTVHDVLTGIGDLVRRAPPPRSVGEATVASP